MVLMNRTTLMVEECNGEIPGTRGHGPGDTLLPFMRCGLAVIL